MRIFSVDQSTSCSGVSLLNFETDKRGNDSVQLLFSDHCKLSTKKYDLQERLHRQSIFINSALKKCMQSKIDFMVREKHDPNGTKANQMFMSSGVVDVIAASKGFLFKAGNYKQLTPIQWRMVSVKEPCHHFKKSTIKENEIYCNFFKDSLFIDGIEKVFSSDVMDSIGLGYAVGVLESSKINKEYFQSLHAEQKRNIFRDGEFREWI